MCYPPKPFCQMCFKWLQAVEFFKQLRCTRDFSQSKVVASSFRHKNRFTHQTHTPYEMLTVYSVLILLSGLSFTRSLQLWRIERKHHQHLGFADSVAGNVTTIHQVRFVDLSIEDNNLHQISKTRKR